jgi:hypothetical protein
MGHHFGSMGHQMGHYLAPMGHDFVPMGHKKGHHSAPMGHYFAMMGHQMGHQSAKMGHKGTPTDTVLTSVGVMVKHKARREGSTRFSGAERPRNQVRVAKADPTSFCILCGLWYTSTNKLSALQGWRHGVRSRSLGHALSSPTASDAQAETTRGFTIIAPRFRHKSSPLW